MFNNVRIDVGEPEDERFLARGSSGRKSAENLTFRWAQTLESVVVVPLSGPRFVDVAEEQRLADYVLSMRGMPFQFPGAPAQEIDVAVNGYPVVTLGLEPRMTEYRLDVPHTMLSRNLNDIRFRYKYAMSPREVGQSDDARPLAVLFDQIDFVQR